MSKKHKKEFANWPKTPDGVMQSHIQTLCIVQRNRCFYCLNEVPATKATIDHIVAKSLGGKGKIINKVMACESCNTTKGSQFCCENEISKRIEFFNGVRVEIEKIIWRPQ